MPRPTPKNPVPDHITSPQQPEYLSQFLSKAVSLDHGVQPLLALLVMDTRRIIIGDATPELIPQAIPVAVRDRRVRGPRSSHSCHLDGQGRVREQLVGVHHEREHVRPDVTGHALPDESAGGLLLEPVGNPLEMVGTVVGCRGP